MRGLAVLFIALQKGQSNRRSHLPGYAAWEIHPVMKRNKESVVPRWTRPIVAFLLPVFPLFPASLIKNAMSKK
jgi:hypothetical protein